MRILIVEDNLVNKKILEMSLWKYDYLTVTARTGKEALECLKSYLTFNSSLLIS